ncbi:putative holin-like toxin [Butyricicoccus sp.]|uniref:putative holin-like toxin n=1 Tax=Butyricicoccus sp. TaxID=2049021 RepID=UPI003F16B251
MNRFSFAPLRREGDKMQYITYSEVFQLLELLCTFGMFVIALIAFLQQKKITASADNLKRLFLFITL